MQKRNPVKTTILVTALLLVSFVTYSQKKQVCISFDDLPLVNYGITDTIVLKITMNKLVTVLRSHNVPAIGFVNERKLYEKGAVNPFQMRLLKSWVDHGLALGNHTFSHPDYNSVSFNDFTADILKGETLSNQILKEKGRSIKYFRHPFLHVGSTKARADSLNDFLVHREYTIAPVTIDNEDYLFALAYKRAGDQHDSSRMKQIGNDYITYMENKLGFYEMLSQKLFSRNIPQILLVHASALNSDYIEPLISMFKRNNYTFVSMDEALKDEAYKTDITVFGAWGISWMDRWALSQGKKGDFFKGDPETPEYIKKLAE